MGPNRRRHARVLAKGLFAEVLSSSHRLKWDVHNLSVGGLFLRTDKVFPAGTTMLLTLRQMGKEASLMVESTVVYSMDAASARTTGAQGGMGIRFENLNPDASQKLAKLIQLFTEAAQWEDRPTLVNRPAVAVGAATRRQDRRVSIHKLQAEVKGEGGESLARAVKVKDISLGGLFLDTEQSLAVGTNVVLALSRPGTDARMEVAGRIVAVVTAREARMRDATPGMSIQFGPMAPEVTDELERMLQSLAPGALK